MRPYIYSFAMLAATTTAVTATAEEGKATLYGWSGSANADYTSSQGNSDNWSVAGGVKATRDWAQWSLTLGAKGRAAATDGNRDAEKYAFMGEGHRKLDDKAYLFAGADYVVDNFSGYDYQATETIGYGRELYTNDALKLDGKLGVGGRQSETEAGVNNSEAVLKPALDLNWAITDTLSFNQGLSSTIGEEYTVTEGRSKLKNALTDNLFLQASYTFTHTSEVPVGRKKLDTYTGIGLAYEF